MRLALCFHLVSFTVDPDFLGFECRRLPLDFDASFRFDLCSAAAERKTVRRYIDFLGIRWGIGTDGLSPGRSPA